MDKKTLRKEIKEKAKGLSQGYTGISSKRITKLFLSSDEYKTAKNLFIYISVSPEPDTSEIILKAFEDNKNVYVPKCISKGNMTAVRITKDTKLVPGYMGIPEPENFCEETDINIDTAVIPCISANVDGKRLGHGAGFYDIFLEKHNPKKICLCFHELLSPEIPMEEYDIYMDAVITEKGIFKK